MTCLFDTSVFVAAYSELHAHHERAWPWVDRAMNREIQAYISLHSLLEIYSTLTRMPPPYRLPPRKVQLMMDEFLSYASTVELAHEDYLMTVQDCAAQEFVRKIVFDSIIVKAAEKAEVDHLLTFNERDFRRLRPEASDWILVP